MLKHPTLGGIVLCLLCGLAQAQPGGPISVIEAQVLTRTWSERIEALATVQANEAITLSSSVADTVARIHFEPGATVRKGQILLELNHAAEAADLRAAHAVLSEKTSVLKRLQELVGQGLSSSAELELAQAQRHSAQAEVESLRAAVEDRIIRAPFAGLLGIRDVSPGAYLQAGQRITTLHDLSALKLEFSLPQTALINLDRDPRLEAHRPGQPEARFPLVLSARDVALDPTTRSLRLQARLEQSDPGLPPGSLMIVVLHANSRQALLVPEAALIPRQDTQAVFVNSDGQAQRRQVKTGTRREGLVEILEGLSAQDRVIVHGGTKLRPGSALKVLGRYDGSVPIAELIQQAGTRP